MRHCRRDTKIAPTSGRHKSMVRGLVNDLIAKERLTTTEKRATVLVRTAEKIITIAKNGDDLASKRRIIQLLGTGKSLAKLTGELAKRYADRPGGYTRIMKLGPRKGDCAPMVIVELLK